MTEETNNQVLSTESAEKSTEQVNLNTENTKTNTDVTEKDTIQADIEKIESAIAQLKEAGEDLFSEEIANLNLKLDNAKAEAEKLATDAQANVQQAVTELKTVEQSFAQKYGQAAAHGVEIILLGVIAGKLLGVL